MSSTVLVPHSVESFSATAPIPEEQLLDVAIRAFDPGVPEGEIDKEVLEELLEDGVFVHIRRAESIHMAVQLRDTLQRSGHWGAAWVTPIQSMAADVNLTARIEHSDGHVVRVHVTAVDATGREWLDEPYEREIPEGVYDRRRYPGVDPYQDLFNLIANDLAEVRSQLAAAEAREIRTVAALRHASDSSPDVFGGYVAADRSGLLAPVRLPAADDPLFERTQRMRQRERLFLEALNGRYDEFASGADGAYGRWREHARQEAISIRDLTRGARWRRALGVAAMVASITSVGSGGSSLATRLARDSLMAMSAGLLEQSAVRTRDRRLHRGILEELSTSFDREVAPMVVKVAGVEHRLTGTLEAQYAQWRELLRQIAASERGFALENVEIAAEPGPTRRD